MKEKRINIIFSFLVRKIYKKSVDMASYEQWCESLTGQVVVRQVPDNSPLIRPPAQATALEYLAHEASLKPRIRRSTIPALTSINMRREEALDMLRVPGEESVVLKLMDSIRDNAVIIRRLLRSPLDRKNLDRLEFCAQLGCKLYFLLNVQFKNLKTDKARATVDHRIVPYEAPDKSRGSGSQPRDPDPIMGKIHSGARKINGVTQHTIKNILKKDKVWWPEEA